MKYRCMCCGTEFDEPAVKAEQAYHGYGIFEPLYLMVCPVCGIEEQYFEYLEDNEDGTTYDEEDTHRLYEP